MHRHDDAAGGPWRHNAAVGPHAVLLGAGRLDLEGEVVVRPVGELHGARDLLHELEGEAELEGLDPEQLLGVGAHLRREFGGRARRGVGPARG